MANGAVRADGRGTRWWRCLGWGGAAVLILTPLVAMQFSSEVDWSLSDFVIVGTMLGVAGLAMELALWVSDNFLYRLASLVAVGACFLLVWVNLAVGFLGDEDNPANLMFVGVILVALIGSIVASFRPAGMARAMFAAASAQLLVGAIGLGAGFASPGAAGLYEVTMGTSLFGALWLFSGAMFRKAAREQGSAGED